MALERHALSAHRARLARQFRFPSRRDRGHSWRGLRQRHRIVDAALALVLARDRRAVRLRRRQRMGRQPLPDEGGVITAVMPSSKVRRRIGLFRSRLEPILGCLHGNVYVTIYLVQILEYLDADGDSPSGPGLRASMLKPPRRSR